MKIYGITIISVLQLTLWLAIKQESEKKTIFDKLTSFAKNGTTVVGLISKLKELM
jgi:hypothetical protein